MTGSLTRLLKALLLSLFFVATGACVPDGVERTESRTGAVSADPGNLDIVFMIDNSSSMTQLQVKMLAQDPGFMTVLENLPNGLPNIHVAVVSSDLGAPGDEQSAIGCTANRATAAFPVGPARDLHQHHADARRDVHLQRRRRSQLHGPLQDVFGCIAQLGENGCGFEHQLASVGARARRRRLAGAGRQHEFLRRTPSWPSSCSPTRTTARPPPTRRSTRSTASQQNIANPDGPIANYRCNGGPRGAHYCQDPANEQHAGSSRRSIRPPTRRARPPRPRSISPTAIDNEQPPTGPDPARSRRSRSSSAASRRSRPIPTTRSSSAPSRPRDPLHRRLGARGGRPEHPAGRALAEVEHSCGALGSDDVNPAWPRRTRPTAASAIRASGSRNGCKRSATTAS